MDQYIQSRGERIAFNPYVTKVVRAWRNQRCYAFRVTSPVLLNILSLPKRDDEGGTSPHQLYLHE